MNSRIIRYLRLATWGFADTDSFISKLDMKSLSIDGRMDSNTLNTHLMRSADDTHSISPRFATRIFSSWQVADRAPPPLELLRTPFFFFCETAAAWKPAACFKESEPVWKLPLAHRRLCFAMPNTCWHWWTLSAMPLARCKTQNPTVRKGMW